LFNFGKNTDYATRIQLNRTVSMYVANSA